MKPLKDIGREVVELSDMEFVDPDTVDWGDEPRGDTGEISDGYHTFNELYRHRHLLFLLAATSGALKASYVVEDHFPNWDLIVAHTPDEYKMVSYHIPYEYRELYFKLPRKTKEEQEKFYDGHTSNDVLQRLFDSIQSLTEQNKKTND